MTGSALTCPKCHGDMRAYERSGVTVDQCGECRGIFLDRGELERLIDGERSWHADSSPPQEPEPVRYGGDRQRSSDHDDRDHDDRDHSGYGGHSRKRRKKSFLDELFD